MAIEVKPHGDANFYSLVDGARWIAVVQLNGEFHPVQQEEMMRRVAAAISPPPKEPG